MNIEEANDNLIMLKYFLQEEGDENWEKYCESIDTLLTAYENLKSYNKGTKEALRVAEDLEHQANKEAGDWEARCFELEEELEEEKKKNKNKDKILRNIREEFLKYDWKNANPIQTYNQIKSLYESIYCKPYEE